jgi:voltage-gated potassium channel Kch
MGGTHWRERVRRFVRAAHPYRWHVLGTARIVAFVLGCIGYWQYWKMYPDPGSTPGPTDLAYQSLKLFLLNSPEHPQLPVALDVARFLAPVVFGWAGLTALGSVVRDRYRQMRLPTMKGHIVICGLGYVGSVFLQHLHDEGKRVVVIESDAAHPNLEMCRHRGVPVIIGNAELERTLEAARVPRASRVLALSDTDAVNIEIVTKARKLAKGREGDKKLCCLARITDPELCQVILIEESRRNNESVHVDFFNTDDVSARLLMDKFRIEAKSQQPHILVAHLDPLGVSVVWHAARDWYDRRQDATAKLKVTVVDDKAAERIDNLKARYPSLEEVCDFIACDPSVGGIHGLTGQVENLDTAYVTAFRDEDALETVLKLRHVWQRGDVRLVVALSRTHGVARLVGDDEKTRLAKRLEVFQTLETACTVELVRRVVRNDGPGRPSALLRPGAPMRRRAQGVGRPVGQTQGLEPRTGPRHRQQVGTDRLRDRAARRLG